MKIREHLCVHKGRAHAVHGGQGETGERAAGVTEHRDLLTRLGSDARETRRSPGSSATTLRVSTEAPTRAVARAAHRVCTLPRSLTAAWIWRREQWAEHTWGRGLRMPGCSCGSTGGHTVATNSNSISFHHYCISTGLLGCGGVLEVVSTPFVSRNIEQTRQSSQLRPY